MPELETTELIILIIASFPIALSYWIVKARKDILKYLPSYYCIYISFVSTNVEALILPDFFNFIEHFSLMLAGIFMFIAIIYDLYTTVIKTKMIPTKQEQGMVIK